MDKDTLQELLKRFDALTSKLGEAGGHVWSWYVRQQVINGWLNLGEAGLALVIAIIAIAASVFCFRKAREDDFENGYAPATVACVVISIVAALVVIFATESAVQYILNPEYYALQSLLGR